MLQYSIFTQKSIDIGSGIMQNVHFCLWPYQNGQISYFQYWMNECFTAQRSAHEQPAVERQDMDHCSVLGGLQMILRGQNFTSESKVIFFEKTHGK